MASPGNRTARSIRITIRLTVSEDERLARWSRGKQRRSTTIRERLFRTKRASPAVFEVRAAVGELRDLRVRLGSRGAALEGTIQRLVSAYFLEGT